MSENQGKKEGLKKYWSIPVGAAIVFLLSLVPIICPSVFERAALYYSSLFFVVLLGASTILLIYVPTRISDKAENRDFRVIHFILRVALTFAIGAVLIGVLLIVALTIYRPLTN